MSMNDSMVYISIQPNILMEHISMQPTTTTT